MKSFYFYAVIIILFLILVILILTFINLGVSLKYEVETPGDCFSLVNGKDLCKAKNWNSTLLILNSTTILSLLVFRKKLIKKR